jgi:Reverse transcriptase (RNA-dependent DNA polymerase)
MLLCLSISQGWKTRQVDFDNTFVQAAIDLPELYIKCPAGFESPEHEEGVVLRLNKSLYGLVQAPMLYYNHLTAGLKTCGLEPSESDPCMFIGQGMIALAMLMMCSGLVPIWMKLTRLLRNSNPTGCL